VREREHEVDAASAARMKERINQRRKKSSRRAEDGGGGVEKSVEEGGEESRIEYMHKLECIYSWGLLAPVTRKQPNSVVTRPQSRPYTLLAST
jgi:hypothetical protein